LRRFVSWHNTKVRYHQGSESGHSAAANSYA
jgi:hypothetical protein